MTRRLFTPFRLLRTGWRRISPAGAKKVAFLSLAVFAVLGIYSITLQREASRVNRQVLYGIEQQTSPEAQKQASERIDTIILDIDCRTQASLQRTIDVLVAKGVLDGGDVRAITEACEKQLADSAPTAGD